ncbi:hypothetical protein [Streptosporangium lutulentum]|uniref:Uncharacterized protein n=1 Tax=Streptosporangium lutulentum TaxID=1461250 RepID=A0ABT9Q821_9ACTN|nr:hypothetical protein [Streptosporangium lutulentum]MDP9842812.1 hypothetical protein [Streptosporangium lutulentum]
MSAPSGDNEFLYELRIEVEEEVILAEASHPEEAVDLPVTEWLFDPTDAEREEIGLRGLLHAVEVLEGDSRSGDHGAANA